MQFQDDEEIKSSGKESAVKSNSGTSNGMLNDLWQINSNMKKNESPR